MINASTARSLPRVAAGSAALLTLFGSSLQAQEQLGEGVDVSALFRDQPRRSSAAYGDVDGDGAADLVFGSNEGFVLRRGISEPKAPRPRFGKIETLRNSGGEPLSVGVSCEVMGRPHLVDLDGDGNLDIAALDAPGLFQAADPERPSNMPLVRWFRGDGKGGFGDGSWLRVDSGEALQANHSTEGLAVADLTGDGHLDVLLLTPVGSRLHTGGAVPLQFAATPRELPIAGAAPSATDWDGDGDLDLVVVEGRHVVLHLDPLADRPERPDAQRLQELPSGANQPRVLTGDSDGDGRVDLLVNWDKMVRTAGDGAPLSELEAQRLAAAERVLGAIEEARRALAGLRPGDRRPETMAARRALRDELAAWEAAPSTTARTLSARREAASPQRVERAFARLHRRAAGSGR